MMKYFQLKSESQKNCSEKQINDISEGKIILVSMSISDFNLTVSSFVRSIYNLEAFLSEHECLIDF